MGGAKDGKSERSRRFWKRIRALEINSGHQKICTGGNNLLK